MNDQVIYELWDGKKYIGKSPILEQVEGAARSGLSSGYLKNPIIKRNGRKIMDKRTLSRNPGIDDEAPLTMKDVEYTKCHDYSPYSPKADYLGMRTFWRAEISIGFRRETIAIEYTKKECMAEARRQINRLNNK